MGQVNSAGGRWGCKGKAPCCGCSHAAREQFIYRYASNPAVVLYEWEQLGLAVLHAAPLQQLLFVGLQRLVLAPAQEVCVALLPACCCSWEPECTLVALAYAHTIELCRTRPSFERFASLSIADAQSGRRLPWLWG